MLQYKHLFLLLCFSITIVHVSAFEKFFDFTTDTTAATDDGTDDRRLVLSYTYTGKSLMNLINKINNSNNDKQEESIHICLIPQLLPSYQVMLIVTTKTQEKTYEVQLQAGQHKYFWYSHLIGDIQSVYMIFDDEIYEYADFAIALYMETIATEQVNNHTLATTSLEDIFNWKPLYGHIEQDFYVFRWQSYPDVLVFSFENRAIQAKYLKRIAFFTEKTNTRGTVQYMHSIANRSGWGAHDYKIEDMVDFYNEVSKKEIEDYLHEPLLNKEERYLQAMLVHLGFIDITDTDTTDPEKGRLRYSVGEGYRNASIVSYARSDSPSLQRVLLFHELLHTIFFRDEVVRNRVSEVWDSLSSKTKKIWRVFMEKNGYDPNFEYLMKNELFAYLLQRPVDDLRWYVSARILAEAIPRMKNETITEQDKQTFIQALIHTAEEFSDYLQTYYFLYDGNMQYVREVE